MKQIIYAILIGAFIGLTIYSAYDSTTKKVTVATDTTVTDTIKVNDSILVIEYNKK